MEPALDVLVITALRDELNAFLTAGGVTREDWEERTNAEPFRYFVRTHKTDEGRPVRFAAVRALEMGEVSAAACAIRMTQLLHPKTLAMCGVCAGRRGSVELGDVIVADRIFKFDDGAAIGRQDEDAGYSVQLYGDIRTYNLPIDWRYAVEEFDDDWSANLPPLPFSMDEQEAHFLSALCTTPEPGQEAPTPENVAVLDARTWPALLERLRRSNLIAPDGGSLTQEGRDRGSFEALKRRHGATRRSGPKLRLGAIGTSARLQRDAKLFDRLSVILRKTIGAEMEGSAIGAVAELEHLQMIMAKGVMDFGDADKDDSFKAYAARAAAEFLLAFLSANAPVAERSRDAAPEPRVATGLSGTPGGEPRPAAKPTKAEGKTPAAQAKTGVGPAEAGFPWFLMLDTELDPTYVGGMLRALTGNSGIVVESSGEPSTYKCSSSEATYGDVLDRLRRGKLRVGRAVGQYVCPAEYVDPEDTNEGKFGRLPRRDGRVISADVVGEDVDWFDIALVVRSLDPKRPLKGRVTFHLHESFDEERIRVKTRGGRARLRVGAWGSFTVGVTFEEETTRLELDLGNLPNVPRAFIDDGRRRKRSR